MVFFLPDAIGGVYSVVNNLLDQVPDPEKVSVIAYSDACIPREQISRLNNHISLTKYTFHCKDNFHHTVRGLGDLIRGNDSCIVATDMLELQMVEFLGLKNPTVFIALGDFEHYYSIAAQHEGIIDAFVAISKEIYDKLILRLPHRAKDIRLAYFPTPEVKEKRVAGSGEMRVVYVSRLEDRKNPLLLSVIDDIWKKKGLRVAMTIVGDGPMRAELEQRIVGRDNFRLLGFLDNQRLHQVYRDNDVFLMTSTSEGLPVSLIEAMKTGLAPVVSDIPGGIREIVENGRTGFLADPSDAMTFAGKIEELIKNQDSYNKMSANAVEFADRTFHPVLCSRRYWEIIAEVSRNRRARTFNPMAPGALDKKWLPNSVVRFLRNTKQKSK